MNLFINQMSSMILYWNKVQWSSEGKSETPLSTLTAHVTFYALSLDFKQTLVPSTVISDVP